MEDRLKYLLTLVSNLVKFAETKNAGLLVATSGLLLMLIDHYPDKGAPTDIRACFWIGGASVTLASVVCLISFIPHLEIPGLTSTEKPQTDDNLIFFRHIAKYSATDFLNALYVADGLNPVTSKIQLDLAGQVIANACISLKKFRYYTLASWLAGLGVLLLAIGAIQTLAR